MGSRQGNAGFGENSGECRIWGELKEMQDLGAAGTRPPPVQPLPILSPSPAKALRAQIGLWGGTSPGCPRLGPGIGATCVSPPFLKSSGLKPRPATLGTTPAELTSTLCRAWYQKS